MFYQVIWFILFVCLFLRGLLSQSRIVHSYRDVTITGEGLQNKVDLHVCLAFMAIEL